MLRWGFLLMAFLSLPVSASLVEQVLPNKQTAKAEFRAGEAGKPTVLLMHGFLQTHEFPTIHGLIDGLSSAGYGVLAPTLTLGVTHRKQGMACEAIHMHSMDDAVKEIAAWVDWLKARNTPAIVLMGHSFGSVQTMAYLSKHRDPLVRKLIGVSAAEGRMKVEGSSRDEIIKQTRALVKSGNKQLLTLQFSFCKKYQGPPASVLSYIEWTPRRIISEARRLSPPVTFIMGSRDDRLGPDWINQLKQTKARVRVIEGANHFMDGEYEFDMLDVVLRELEVI